MVYPFGQEFHVENNDVEKYKISLSNTSGGFEKVFPTTIHQYKYRERSDAIHDK